MRRSALALLLGCLLLVAGASALDGYDYYQTIEYAACDQDIYQQDIVIHRTTGTAYNETAGGLETWHIFIGEHCREDYGDVRFTNSTGAELAYYLWPGHTSSSARFTVRLEGATSAGVLQVWYGNPTAATTSDGSTAYIAVLGDAAFAYTSGSGTLIVDQTGQSGDCAITGATWVPGRVGNALSFTGTDRAVGSTSLPGVSSAVTAVAWIRTSSTSITVPFHKYAGGNGWMIILQSDGVAGIHGRDGSGIYRSCNGITNVADGEWHLIVGTVDGRYWKIYVDGVLENTLDTNYANTNLANPSAAMKFGENHDRSVYFSGQVDSAAVFPYALSIDEIQALVEGTWDVTSDAPRDLLVRAYSATPPAALTFSGEQETAAPPVTAFTASPTAGLAPLTVQFTDTSTGSPTAWAWTFGDGGTSSEQNPQHTYTAPGLYTVTLTATNEYGSDYELKTDYITVYSPITAQFTANVTGGTAPVAVQFTDLSTGGPTAWSWSFGDGNTSAAQNPVHTYTTAGTHTVTLTASHPYSSDTETKTAYITVAVLQPFPGLPLIPRDLTGNGLYTDINGNNRLDYNDLTVFFQHLAWAKANQPTECFDFNGNGWLDYNDVITLFSTIMEEHT